MVQDIKDMVESNPRTWTFSHLVHYPEFPSGLPQEVFEQAYDEEHQPVTIAWDRLTATAFPHGPLRKNSALLNRSHNYAWKDPCSQLSLGGPFPSATVTRGQLRAAMSGQSQPRQWLGGGVPSGMVGRQQHHVLEDGAVSPLSLFQPKGSRFQVPALTDGANGSPAM